MGDVDAATIELLSIAESSGLSRRGLSDLDKAGSQLKLIKKVLGNQYDEQDNPDGLVVLGVADNSLTRKELIEFFTSPGRLVLKPVDLTYADSFFASKRVMQAIAGLYNEVPDGFYDETTWTPPIKRIETDHFIIGNGATEIIEACFWDLCDEGDGVLLSAPYYNAFDDDLTLRAKVKIVAVHQPLPEPANGKDAVEPVDAFSAKTVRYYEDAIQDAKQKGIRTKAVLICNPHNPTGGIYPRETIVALAKFAAKHDLHLVMDEIYARSCFSSQCIPKPTQFDSILSIDVKREAGLDPSRVHVISSASKDFSINGFRLGIFISQHNDKLIQAMFTNARFAQTASPAGQLFASLLNDRKYLKWFLQENRKRMSLTFDWTVAFLDHHKIPFTPAAAGHFLLIDLRKFLGSGGELEGENSIPAVASADGTSDIQSSISSKPATPERSLTWRFIDGGVLVAPGTQYHHPTKGFFRLTFTVFPKTLQVGLARMEKVLGLKPWIESQPLPQFD